MSVSLCVSLCVFWFDGYYILCVFWFACVSLCVFWFAGYYILCVFWFVCVLVYWILHFGLLILHYVKRSWGFFLADHSLLWKLYDIKRYSYLIQTIICFFSKYIWFKVFLCNVNKYKASKTILIWLQPKNNNNRSQKKLAVTKRGLWWYCLPDRENQRKQKERQVLALARKLRKLWTMKVTVMPIVINLLVKGGGRFGTCRTSRDHPIYSIVGIGQRRVLETKETTCNWDYSDKPFG